MSQTTGKATTRLTLTLIHGLRLGDETYKDVVLREATAGDVLDAQEAAERLVFSPAQDGGSEPVLVASPSRVGVEVLRRQIVSVGDISGPLELKLLHKLHPEDLNLLLARTEQLDGAAVAQAQSEAESRGRSDGDRQEPA
ncbi:phage tail assembly protein [Halomonas sp.]|uniref:phage tail assembly protein n=1 Tax=Halomonas sp. TaxID=1486246 RepID=UPI00298E0E2C|nr:phage tail assembly protein [Halomonas sp.]MDW7745874.1 phage tail assembly protein [Halomonas sp.]